MFRSTERQQSRTSWSMTHFSTPFRIEFRFSIPSFNACFLFPLPLSLSLAAFIFTLLRLYRSLKWCHALVFSWTKICQVPPITGAAFGTRRHELTHEDYSTCPINQFFPKLQKLTRNTILTCFMFYARLGNIRICEYNPPPPPWWRHIRKNDQLEKFWASSPI